MPQKRKRLYVWGGGGGGQVLFYNFSLIIFNQTRNCEFPRYVQIQKIN